jgi:hypothetical protein
MVTTHTMVAAQTITLSAEVRQFVFFMTSTMSLCCSVEQTRAKCPGCEAKSNHKHVLQIRLSSFSTIPNVGARTKVCFVREERGLAARIESIPIESICSSMSSGKQMLGDDHLTIRSDQKRHVVGGWRVQRSGTPFSIDGSGYNLSLRAHQKDRVTT